MYDAHATPVRTKADAHICTQCKSTITPTIMWPQIHSNTKTHGRENNRFCLLAGKRAFEVKSMMELCGIKASWAFCACVCMCEREREREKQRERETERETERDREREQSVCVWYNHQTGLAGP